MKMQSYLTSYNPKPLKINRILTILLIGVLSFYIIYHLISGDRGFLALFKVSKKYQVLSENIKDLEEQKVELEKKVYMLKSESLNLDLLEEQAKRNLGYSKKGEVVYVD